MSSPAARPYRRKATVSLAVLITAASALVGCGHRGAAGETGDGATGETGGPDLTVEDQVVGAVPGDAAAVYLSIHNEGTDDALLGARCACAQETSLHSTEDRNGISLMVPTDRVDLPSGETIVFEPGGSHLMLDGLTEPLEAGTGIEVALEFEHGGTRTVEVPVIPLDELAHRVDR